MKILALDYGEKRIGLAVGDSENKIAFPFGILENKGAQFVLRDLKKIISEEEFEKIVVGIPESLKKDYKSPEQRKIEDFVKFLKKSLDISVETYDERLSTKIADSLAQNKKYATDDLAACVVLESYLSKLN